MGRKWRTYTRKSAQCPFYKKETTQVIYCSGIEDNSSIHMAFGNASECKAYKDTICGCHYNQCKVFSMLEEAIYSDQVPEQEGYDQRRSV